MPSLINWFIFMVCNKKYLRIEDVDIKSKLRFGGRCWCWYWWICVVPIFWTETEGVVFTTNSTTVSVLKDPAIFTAFGGNFQNGAHLSTKMFADLFFTSVFWVVWLLEKSVMILWEMIWVSLLDREANDDQESKKDELFKHWFWVW